MFKYNYLKSGCRLLTIPRKDTRSTHIAIFVRVGSKDEEEGEFGMAHFLEHMLFKGNKKLQTQLKITKNLDRIGSDYNAFTTKNTTCYHISVASKYSTKAFNILSNMVLHSTLENKKMRKEQRVVVEEFNKMIDNVTRYTIENAFQLIFKDTTLGRPTIGYVDSIMGLTHSSLNKFYRKFYKKDNMLIVVAGKISSDLKSKIYGTYGRLTRESIKTIRKAPDYVKGVHFPIDYGLPRELTIKLYNCRKGCNTICLDKRGEVKQSNIIIAYKIGGLYEDDNHVLEVVKQYLGGGMSSNLFQKIRTRLGLAYTITCEMELYEEGGVFMIYAGTDGVNAKKVVNKILEEINRLTKTLVEPKEIKACLDTLTGRLELSEENGMNVALKYGARALFNAKIHTNKKIVNDVFIPKVMTPKRIRETVRKYLIPKNLYISITGDHPLSFPSRLLK